MKLGIRRFWQAKHSWLGWLWLGAPVAMWLAYQPLIRFGQDETMYFELSLALIYVFIMALVGLLFAWKDRAKLVKSRVVWVVSSFVLISMTSLLWTDNLTRGVLTVGVLGLLYLIFLGAFAMGDKFRRMLPAIVRVYVFSSLAACVLAILQFFAGIWFDSSTTLLCAGCVAEQFGFARPNVFLVEPQFLGSALLPAGLLFTRRVVLKLPTLGLLRGPSVGRDFGWWALGLVVAVLVLTLSRGALLAFAVGVIVLMVVYREELIQWLKVFGVLIVSFALALCMQGFAAMINPTLHETFAGAVSKSVNQLTMGVVDLPDSFSRDEEQATSSQMQASGAENQMEKKPNFDGYIEESTTARTSRSELALKRWGSDWQTIVFGVGVGSAGVAINQAYPDQLGAREIVQNEYIEVLLERGLIGLVSFISILIGLFWLTRYNKWLWAIISAFMVQWLFFSGYPNALHVYMALIVIGLTTVKSRLFT